MEIKVQNKHRMLLEKFSQEEMHLIVQIKRFFECYEGDSDFRAAVNSGYIDIEQLRYMKKIGISFNFKEVALFWENRDLIDEYINLCRKANSTKLGISEELTETLKKYPLMELWLRFMMSRSNYRYEECVRDLPIKNDSFEQWRKRRIAAAKSELGTFNQYIRHPILSFELSEGCSIQCWFCSFSAPKLKKTLDYLENKDFFREIIQICTDIFGHEATGVALPYYATEPYDNPHYLNYLQDYYDITGSVLCTSTAVCTDKTWVDNLIAFYRKWDKPWPRLSVLSTKILRTIHENHSPDDLRDVELAMQMKDSEYPKISGGRIFKQNDDMRIRDNTNYLQGIIPQGTIACVSGFYINLVKKTIKLVSPCYTSERWPYGYRIFDETYFTTTEDFHKAILDIIERSMPKSPRPDMPLKLRDDLVYRQSTKGFELVSPFQIHHFYDKKIFHAAGNLMASPHVTYQRAIDLLVDKYGQNPFEVHAVLDHLFDDGFLDEVKY